MRSSDAYRLGVDIGIDVRIDARNGANPFDVVARCRHARPDIQRNPFSHLPMAIRQSPVRACSRRATATRTRFPAWPTPSPGCMRRDAVTGESRGMPRAHNATR